MRYLLVTILGILFGTFSQAAFPYDVLTHGNLSEKALEASLLGMPGVLTDIGLKEILVDEKKQGFPNSKGTNQSIKDLFRTGANFEDDSPRPANHFFDPFNNKALNVGGATLGMKSPDWALEDTGVIGNQASSYRDARQYVYDALTSPAQTDRDKNFGLTFQTLGQVIHHIQDMAQPQHVRNDDHCDRWYCALAGMYNPSLYEKYTDQNRNNLPYTGYNSAMFPTARQFWTGGINGNGQGMADFTNRNFVSAGTNFTGALAAIVKNPNYPSPDGIGAILITRQVTDADLLGANQPLNGEIDFIGTPVMDSYRGGASGTNSRTSSYSLFDADLSIIGANKTFTLNRFNFDAAHQFLVPRAVGYSAGLIDYFFRGKLDFVPDTVNAGNYIIKNLGPEAMTGSFTLYYDAVDGKRYPVSGDAMTETWAGRTIAVNGQLDNLSFTPPTSPAPKNAGEFMLVFKGDMGEEKAVNGAVGALAAKFIQPGATDYVAMNMPNPVPYRGVSFRGKPKTIPYIKTNSLDTTPWSYVTYRGGVRAIDEPWSFSPWTGQAFPVVNGVPGTHTGSGGTYSFIWYGSDGSEIVALGPFISSMVFSNGAAGGTWVGGRGYSRFGYSGYAGISYSDFPPGSPTIIVAYDAVGAPGYTGDVNAANLAVAQAAADVENAKPEYAVRAYVMASDGTVISSTPLTYTFIANGLFSHYDIHPWRGGGTGSYSSTDNSGRPLEMFQYSLAVPEDCIYPPPTSVFDLAWRDPYNETYPGIYPWGNYPYDELYSLSRVGGVYYKVQYAYNIDTGYIYEVGSSAIGTELNVAEAQVRDANIAAYIRANPTYSTEITEWYAHIASGETAFNLRRKNWFKKNSDEFIAALKTGFAADAPEVTRAELKLGRLPEAWEYQIKLDVDKNYWSYPRDQYSIRVGRHTRRVIQYSETAYTETVQSDTSSNLTQAGVKVTQRVVSLGYQIDVNGVTEIREATITGYLTQTVTRHNNAQGGQLGLSRRDVYDNWYNREAAWLPSGTYLEDRTTNRIGAVLNGAVQNGYVADSSMGQIGNPLTYELYNPPYPKASSTVTATVPEYIKTWHKDAKIEYLEDGVGASSVQNDSALYGIRQIEITPIGLIADGNGNAPAGASLGVFSSGETGTQAEIYGTAVYNFDWQTGALTFSSWKPLKDANGNEVASKVIDLPAGTTFPINNSIITYKGLHWPDVVNAIKERDNILPTATIPSDKLLYELIKAINAG